jgi:hypothetical protein
MSWLISRAMMEQCGSLRCSRALVAASSADTCSDGEPSAPSSTTPTPQAYLCRDKTTDAWRRFPSGMTCGHLTADRGEELLTLFREGSPAKTFPPPDEEPESTESKVDCGQKWLGSLARYDPATRTWKTRQCLLVGDLAEYAETWPSWGMTRGGELFRRPMRKLSQILAACTFPRSVDDLPSPAVVGSGTRLAHRVDRLKSIGNGQCPQAAALAWQLLMEDQE